MFLKNKNIIFKIRRSKVTDYAALRKTSFFQPQSLDKYVILMLKHFISGKFDHIFFIGIQTRWHSYSPVKLFTCHLYPLLPHLRGWAGIMIFNFQSPGLSPAYMWGQADGNNLALCPFVLFVNWGLATTNKPCPALHIRKSHRGKCPNVITFPPPHFPGTLGTLKK